MKLRIGIDGRVFIGNKTGVGHYVSELCKALDRVLPDVKFYIYNRDKVELPVSSPNWILRTEASLLKKNYRISCGLNLRQDFYAGEIGLISIGALVLSCLFPWAGAYGSDCI